MGKYAVVDDSQAPIFHVQVVGEPTDQSFEEYLSDVEDSVSRLGRCGMVFNAGALNHTPARYRDRLSGWLNETKAEFEDNLLCGAFVIPGRVVRGLLSTVFWLSPPYYSIKVVSSEHEAWAWVQDELVRFGVLEDEGSSRGEEINRS